MTLGKNSIGRRGNWLQLAAALAFVAPTMATAAPALLYTDLAAAPNTGGTNNAGAFVTLFGRGFGSTQGSVTVGGGAVAGVQSWTDTQIVVQLGAQAKSGEILVRTGSGANAGGVQFTVRAGRILEATPSTAGSVVSSVQSGDVVYLRGGTYTGRYGTTTWGAEQFTLGSWAQNVAFVGYPGESVSTKDWRLGDGGGKAHNVTLAKLKMVGSQSCVHGDGWWESEESGTSGVRVVGVDCQCTYNNNTMTGMITVPADGWRVLGNYLHDTGTSPPINNNHSVYIQTGPDNVEVAWNRFERLKVGYVVQVHTDGTPRSYQNIRIHDNEFVGGAPGDMRGVVSGNVADDSTVFVYNNIFRNLGQDVSAVTATGGNVVVEHNTFDGILATYGVIRAQWGSSQRITARNNIINPLSGSKAFGADNGASLSQITQEGNQTNATLTSAMIPTNAIKGVTTTYVTDHAGQPRTNPPTVGAYETGSVGPIPQAPTAVTAR